MKETKKQKRQIVSISYEIEYRLQDCNGYELYSIHSTDTHTTYQVYSPENIKDAFEVFKTLKEARAWARTH